MTESTALAERMAAMVSHSPAGCRRALRPALAGCARSRASVSDLTAGDCLTTILNYLRMVLMLTSLVQEGHPGGGFLSDYWSILTDPAHIAVEVTLMVLLDGLLL